MQNRSKLRGRPRGRGSHATARAIDYLAKMAINNHIDPSELFNNLIYAWKHEESTCNNLVIRRRLQSHDSVTFLFTIGQKVLAQFTVPEQVLLENNPIKGYIDKIPPQAFSPKKIVAKNPKKIIDLKRRMRHVNIKARVLETPDPNRVLTRYGTEAYVSNVLIADETGTIRLSLWNKQINKVSVNDVIKIENAKVASFRGKRQLRLERSGKLNVIEGEGFPPLMNLKLI